LLQMEVIYYSIAKFTSTISVPLVSNPDASGVRFLLASQELRLLACRCGWMHTGVRVASSSRAVRWAFVGASWFAIFLFFPFFSIVLFERGENVVLWVRMASS
jgi:hypothetical protein